MSLAQTIREVIKSNDLERMENLSIMLHTMESNGVELPPLIDYLWGMLTLRIQQKRASSSIG